MKKTLSALLVTFALALSTPAFAAGQLGDDVVPRSETIRLEIDPAGADYSGVATVLLGVRRPAHSFRLHAEEMEIDEVSIFDRAKRGDVSWSFDEDGLLNVAVETPLEPGAATMTIRFHNELGTQAVGLYKTVYQGSPYAFTFFEPNDAREAFPCFDEPRFKITFQISVRIPETYTAVSNTPVATTTSDEGWKAVAFEPTKPLPSYLLQVSVGELESVPIPGLRVPGSVVVPKGTTKLATTAAEMTAPIMTSLEEWFGMQYPYEKIDLIAVPEFWAGAMEQPGAVTFADRVILLDPDSASANQRSSLAMVIAHELSHMWFGDLVTMSWWDDLWLNESFAEWMGNLIANEVFPEYQRDLAAMWSTQSVMGRDARSTSPKVRQPIENADQALSSVGIAYEKGEAVLRMFEGWLGQETFQAGVRQYLKENAWGNAEASDLWSSLGAASGRDVAVAMGSFIEQNGFPLIRVDSNGGGTVKVSQERFHNAGAEVEPQSWVVPIRILEPGHEVTSILLDGPSMTVDLGDEGSQWIFPNAGGAGYYRWTTSPENLKNLTAAAGGSLSPAERISLLGNLSSLLDAGEISGDLYLDSLLQFAEDPEPQVITGLVGLAARLKLPLVPEELEDQYAHYIRALLKPAMTRYGVEPKEGEPEVIALVRPRLWGLLGDEGEDPEVLAAAEDLAAEFAKDPSAVNPSLARVAVLLTVQNGSEAQLADVIQRFQKATSPSERGIWLSAIGGFHRPDLQRKAVEFALSDQVRPPDVFRIVGGAMSTPEGRKLVWNWLRENFDVVASRFPRPFMAFMPGFAGGCSMERLDQAREFFADEAHRVEGTDARLAETAEAVTDCVNLRQREVGNVSHYLGSLPSE